MVRKVKSLAQSFKFAFRGIFFCIKNERNMRIHLTAAAYVLTFSVFYNFSSSQYLIIFLTIGMVLSAEALNTAVEALVNLETQSYDSLARIAKDAAAGAVLICAAFAFVVGIILYLKPDIIAHIINFLLQNVFWGILFILSLPASAVFIFGIPSGTALFRRKM